jgi:surface protein
MRVDWGDGNVEVITNHTLAIHTYASAGTYTISVTGSLLGWQFNNTGDRLKMLDVKQWSGLNISIGSGFRGCTNLTATATDSPLITGALDFYFDGCTNFNGAIGSWDVSNVTSMGVFLGNCVAFNQPIGSWDVSNVTNFGAFLRGATLFNQYIGDWDTSSVTKMGVMFSGATSFNQNISTKTVNAGLPNEYVAWNTSNVNEMFGQFLGATSFNQNIGGWNVSKVIGTSTSNGFYRMFYNATAFNNGNSDDIDNWIFSTTSNITMEEMFGGLNTTSSCKFNRYIGSWITSKISNFNAMFINNTSFNQDISNWDLSNTTSLRQMFYRASSFNQPIGIWNTSTITDMFEVFTLATSFDQDISNWDINQVSTFTNFMGGLPGNLPTLSTTNYDLLLVDWEANLQALYPLGVGYPFTISINFGGSQYTLLSAAAIARASLVTNFGWTITDSGGI